MQNNRSSGQGVAAFQHLGGFASATALVLSLGACSKPEAVPEPVRAVRTMTVEAGQLGGAAEYAAEVRARVESRLGFRVTGKMVNRAVGLGDHVKAGQVLASLDPQDLQFSQDAARSSLQAASVNLDQAEADFKRFKELRDKAFISAADLERRETTVKAARAQFEQAQALAGVQTNQARYATLVSDASGVVTAVEAEPGAVLTAGTTVLRLAHDGPRDVVFSVPEDQVDAVRALRGRPAALQVRPWGATGALIAATVREVAAAADPATRTFVVKADVGTTNLRLGQTATVVIARPPVAGVIRLPLAAVFEQQGKTSVWLVDRATMTVRAQPIQVAGAEGNLVVVASGLVSGQLVVSAGVHVLTPGQRVAFYGAAPVAQAVSPPQR
jgi:multidrug efflux system membrane fusion protein